MGSSFRNDAVKVVLIDTQYVETDAESFKSVVQRLTGKDSSVSWIEKSSFIGISSTPDAAKTKKQVAAVCTDFHVSDHSNGVVRSAMPDGGQFSPMLSLTGGLSFKDSDRMLLEMPPMDQDLQCWLWNE